MINLEYAEPKPKNLSFSFKAGRGWGRDAKNWKVFWFWTRVKRAPRGAVVRITMRAERTEKCKATMRSARAKHAINRFAIESRFERRLKYLHKQGLRQKSDQHQPAPKARAQEKQSVALRQNGWAMVRKRGRFCLLFCIQ